MVLLTTFWKCERQDSEQGSDFSQATTRQDEKLNWALLIPNLNPGLPLTFLRPRASVQVQTVPLCVYPVALQGTQGDVTLCAWLDTPSCTLICSLVPSLYSAFSSSPLDHPWHEQTSGTVYSQEDELRKKAHTEPGKRLRIWPRKYGVLDNWNTVWPAGKEPGLQAGKSPWICRPLTPGEGSSLRSVEGPVPQA